MLNNYVENCNKNIFKKLMQQRLNDVVSDFIIELIYLLSDYLMRNNLILIITHLFVHRRSWNYLLSAIPGRFPFMFIIFSVLHCKEETVDGSENIKTL